MEMKAASSVVDSAIFIDLSDEVVGIRCNECECENHDSCGCDNYGYN